MVRRPFIEARICWGDTRLAELNRIGTVDADVRIVKRRERLDGKVNIAGPGRLHARMHRELGAADIDSVPQVALVLH